MVKWWCKSAKLKVGLEPVRWVCVGSSEKLDAVNSRGEGWPGLDVRSEIGLPTAAAGRNAGVEICLVLEELFEPLENDIG